MPVSSAALCRVDGIQRERVSHKVIGFQAIAFIVASLGGLLMLVSRACLLR